MRMTLVLTNMSTMSALTACDIWDPWQGDGMAQSARSHGSHLFLSIGANGVAVAICSSGSLRQLESQLWKKRWGLGTAGHWSASAQDPCKICPQFQLKFWILCQFMDKFSTFLCKCSLIATLGSQTKTILFGDSSCLSHNPKPQLHWDQQWSPGQRNIWRGVFTLPATSQWLPVPNEFVSPIFQLKSIMTWSDTPRVWATNPELCLTCPAPCPSAKHWKLMPCPSLCVGPWVEKSCLLCLSHTRLG